MSILQELNQILRKLKIPVETGVFTGKPDSGSPVPDEYIVITPMSEVYELHADNAPLHETQEARLSLFSRGNYIRRKNQIVKALLAADMTITGRRYIGYEADTGYHHYGIDVAQNYKLED